VERAYEEARKSDDTTDRVTESNGGYFRRYQGSPPGTKGGTKYASSHKTVLIGNCETPWEVENREGEPLEKKKTREKWSSSD